MSNYIINVSDGIGYSKPVVNRFSSGFDSIRFVLDLSMDLSGCSFALVSSVMGDCFMIAEDGIELTKGQDETTGKAYLDWTLKRAVTAADGVVIYQIIAYTTNADGTMSTVWYSPEGRLVVGESISLTEYETLEIGSHPSVVMQILAKTSANETNISDIANNLSSHAANEILAHPDGSVTEDKLSDQSVSTQKMAQGAVTEEKIADGAIVEGKLAQGAVTEEKISNSAVTEQKIADKSITRTKLSDEVSSILESIAKLPTHDDVKSEVSSLVNSAPETLDTLKEIADALGNDQNFASTMTSKLAKVDTDISSLESRVDTIGQDVDANKADIDISKADITSLESRVDTIGQDINMSKADIDSLRQSFDAVKTQSDANSERIDNLKYFPMIQTTSGTNLSLTDAATMQLYGLNVYGKTTQQTTTGKNLFCFSSAYSLTASGVTATADSGTSVIKVSGKATANFAPSIAVASLPAGTYTLSMSGLLGANDYVFLKNTDTSAVVVPTLKNGKSGTFTITEASGFVLGLVILSSSDYAYSDATVYLQIESGETATDYEPYTNAVASPSPEYSQDMQHVGTLGKINVYVNDDSLSLALQPHLAGIPVSSDGNYTDENGQMWICDEIDLENGKYIKRINTYTITGKENWQISATQSSADGKVRYDALVAYPSAKGYDVMCNCFPYRGANITNGIGAWIYSSGASYINLRVVTSNATLDEFKAFLAQQYDALTPVTVQYILASPQQTDISDEEISAYKALATSKVSTSVTNDEGAYMQLTYVLDAKTYIDSAIEELRQSIANTNDKLLEQ